MSSLRDKIIEDGRDAFHRGMRFDQNPYKIKEERKWWARGFGVGASEEVAEMMKDPKSFWEKRGKPKEAPVSKPKQLDLF